MKKWIIWLGGILLAAALIILGRDGRALKKVEKGRDDLIATGIAKDQKKAEKLNKKANKLKAGALAANEATVKRLENISANDTDMDDLLSAFESERVRQQSG